MGSLSTQLPPCSSSTADANPQWMLLAPYGGGIEEDCNITGDTKTIAAAATSNGQHISVSLRREPFSALSRICLCFLPGTGNDRQSAYSTVITAHGGSVLLKITSNEGYLKPKASDYFVYSNMVAANTPARPPSLYLLPRYTSAKQCRELNISATGLLCHGEAEFVVADLKIVGSKEDTAAASPTAFELHLYRYGEWCVKRPRILGDYHGKEGELLDLGLWVPQAVVPPGDGLLCWVDWWRYRGRGVIFSNVLDKSPELRYVPYPAEAVNYRCFLCTRARGALKLVSLSPGRCSHCGCSEHATAVNTWALKTDDMAWVLETETMVDSTDELWALETMVGVGYARVHLVYPVAIMNGGGHHVVPEESSAPTEEEDEHVAGKGRSHKGNVCIRTEEEGSGELSSMHGDPFS